MSEIKTPNISAINTLRDAEAALREAVDLLEDLSDDRDIAEALQDRFYGWSFPIAACANECRRARGQMQGRKVNDE